jgi:hypothetical protein
MSAKSGNVNSTDWSVEICNLPAKEFFNCFFERNQEKEGYYYRCVLCDISLVVVGLQLGEKSKGHSNFKKHTLSCHDTNPNREEVERRLNNIINGGLKSPGGSSKAKNEGS